MYRILAWALVAIAGTFYGMAACKFQLFPYPEVRSWYESHLEPIPAEYLATPEHYTRTDVDRLISIHRPEDIEQKRRALITVLWGKPVLPDALPSTVDRDFHDGRYDDIPELARIDRLTVSMDFGLEFRAYHFVPETPNERLVIYHQGHRGDFHESKPQIRRFLEEGYTVAALTMPLLGLNNQPTIELPGLGHLTLTEHDNMRFLSPEHGIPVQYFIEPVVVVLNHLAREFEPSNLAMTGISGGGWTTTLAAAVDERIRHSFPVAGSYPLYLRSRSARDWGDYEQNLPELYRTVNYLDMYVLGAAGEGRQQLQIINQFDRCCFAGTKWETYKEVVRDRVEGLGAGDFDLFMDDSHRDHRFSDAAMRRILDELQHPEVEQAKRAGLPGPDPDAPERPCRAPETQVAATAPRTSPFGRSITRGEAPGPGHGSRGAGPAVDISHSLRRYCEGHGGISVPSESRRHTRNRGVQRLADSRSPVESDHGMAQSRTTVC